MASQTLISQNPSFLHSTHPSPPFRSISLIRTALNFSAFSSAQRFSLKKISNHVLSAANSKPLVVRSSSSSPSSSPPTLLPPEYNLPTSPSVVASSTRTIAAIFALAVSASRIIASRISNQFKSVCIIPTTDELDAIKNLQRNVVCAVGPLFFAAIRNQSSVGINTPLTVVAAGMAKWLDIYSGVLMVRVLLSWFPNIPWDRQPLSAIRDLCDPYLNLFRNIIPPIFDTLDVSPLLAFALLGTFGSILNSSRGSV
ncbi:ylmG homolog protein 1-2, chloroplastic-like [Impatiens glandulifera]|uniref:ylmG homolog protein 1-2, chloroplastic-like n=1 Tax=Impatiens glandulifera TaxID=253017 RepID=UPI001FB17286|nr:ylmG homolog protein 1-2, chloroplastic-like [Impatiens glandulifera]